MVASHELSSLEQQLFISKPTPGRMAALAHSHDSRDLDKYLYWYGIPEIDFLDMIAKMAKAHPSKPVVVFDLMCGNGYTVHDLNDIDCVVAYGIDCESYRSWSSAPGQFIQHSVETLPFIKDRCADLVLSLHGVLTGYVSDHESAVRESVRILRVGGVALHFPCVPNFDEVRSLLPQHKLKLTDCPIMPGTGIFRTLMVRKSNRG